MKRLAVFLIMLSSSVYGQDTKTTYKIVGSKTVYQVSDKNLYIFTSGFMIDADGAPKAYHSDNSKGLDYLANAGKTGNWWALVTDNGKSSGVPLVQKEGDPAPGYYISMTALEDKTKAASDPRRYVNSSASPYIALPPNLAYDFKLGDIALVINKRTNKQCYAIFADIGPASKIGEGSIYLAEQLGIPSSPKFGGVAADIVYILFKKSGSGTVLTKEAIVNIGKSKLSAEDIDELIR